MNRVKTEQEDFWASEFGDSYIGRNRSDQLLASNLQFFSNALLAARSIESCLEFGANIGMNLRALKLLFPLCRLAAVEINKAAAEELRMLVPSAEIFNGAIQDYPVTDSRHELVFTKGVLIHLNPDALPETYEKMYRASSRYVLIAEYYNPSPVAISYRGHENKLFKRDFAGEMLERYQDLQLIDYGFAYRRDPKFPQDDINWFLLEKIPQ